jgi:hypothetical protein
MEHKISVHDSHQEYPDVFPEGWQYMVCDCTWSSQHSPAIDTIRSEAQHHLQTINRLPRYTAGYKGDGSVNFVKALTRPSIGAWEFPDWVQDDSHRPTQVTHGSRNDSFGLPVHTCGDQTPTLPCRACAK